MSGLEEIKNLSTEKRNRNSESIDTESTVRIVEIMNQEDRSVPEAICKVKSKIVEAIDVIAPSLKRGDRLIYIGAGTSGRLGVLDASECPPTFGTDPSQILGIIAGGEYALRNAVENAEDSFQQGKTDLQNAKLIKGDVVVGIAASGRTPYVLGALEYAKSIGCATVGVTCNDNSEISKQVDIPIDVEVGPEIVTGSTRLKAGTSQKLILNMLTTASMIKNGKVYGNLMVDVQATNKKLIKRQESIVVEATGASPEIVQETFEKNGRNVKASIVMILASVSSEKAMDALGKSGGNVRLALEHIGK